MTTEQAEEVRKIDYILEIMYRLYSKSSRESQKK
jgi:hypothetical protein